MTQSHIVTHDDECVTAVLVLNADEISLLLAGVKRANLYLDELKDYHADERARKMHLIDTLTQSLNILCSKHPYVVGRPARPPR